MIGTCLLLLLVLDSEFSAGYGLLCPGVRFVGIPRAGLGLFEVGFTVAMLMYDGLRSAYLRR